MTIFVHTHRTSSSQLVDPSITEMSKRCVCGVCVCTCACTDPLTLVMHFFLRMTDLQSRPRQSLTPDPELKESQEKELDQGQEMLSVSTKAEGIPAAEEPREEPDSGQEQEKPLDTEPAAIADEPQTKPDPSTQVTEVGPK